MNNFVLSIKVIDGKTIATKQSLTNYPRLHMLVHNDTAALLIKVIYDGENAIDEVLETMSAYYEDECDDQSSWLTAMEFIETELHQYYDKQVKIIGVVFDHVGLDIDLIVMVF